MEQTEIKEILLKLGVSPHHSGFSYLVSAIKLCCDNTAVRNFPIGTIYSEVAKMHGTNDTAVVQAIRRAIHYSWLSHNSDLDKMFRYRAVDKIPPALEYITRISDFLLERSANNV